MLPILPREMLWTDLKTMDEFFRLDPINEEFFEVFITLRDEPFGVKMDAVKVFNEVYYQITRMVFEHPLPTEVPRYVNDIKANMGWNYSAELVMSMVYSILDLFVKKKRPLNGFFTMAIGQYIMDSIYWKPFGKRFRKMQENGQHVKYTFAPRPIDPKLLLDNYINWSAITRNYDLMCIECVIELWTKNEDKRDVAVMINDSLTCQNFNLVTLSHIQHFLTVYLVSDDNAAIWNRSRVLPTAESKNLKERALDADKEKAALQKRISELESENIRLSFMLEKNNKNTGKNRVFTLVQIVDYCINCVEWNDAKDVVVMLNKLLRVDGTKEDSELVDSIETDFKQRRFGSTTFKDATVTMNNPTIDGPLYRVSHNQDVKLGE